MVCFRTHCGHATDTDERDVINLRIQDLTAFICLACNFVKIKVENMHKHLKDEHQFPVDSLEERYKRFVLVPAVWQQPQANQGTRYSLSVKDIHFDCEIFSKLNDEFNDFVGRC